MNRCGLRTELGNLEHSFFGLRFKPLGWCFPESFDGPTKAAPKQGGSPEGCENA
jgi:hypothetical protein